MRFFESVVVNLVIAFAVALSFNIVGKSCNAAGPYDYFQFVQQSPYTYCNANPNCKSPLSLPRTFTIHGLWPSNTSNLRSDCRGTKFSKPEMNAPYNHVLQLNLLVSWPSFDSKKSDMDFWEHEYDKHGTCSENKFPQTQYFELAWNLWYKYEAYALFSAAKPHPIAPGNQYLHIDLVRAIRPFINLRRPLLRCKMIGVGTQQQQLLLEVIICFDDSGINPVDCSRITNCHPRILIWYLL